MTSEVSLRVDFLRADARCQELLSEVELLRAKCSQLEADRDATKKELDDMRARASVQQNASGTSADVLDVSRI